MTRFVLIIAALLITSPLLNSADAAPADTKEALSEMSIGSADAPVTIYEYSSLTCPHCAAFHRDTLPEIQEKYIDTGKVRLVYADFPLGQLALAGSMLARCAGPAMYPGLVDIMFRDQATWTRSQNPLDDLINIGRFAGLTPDEVTACVSNQELGQELLRRKDEAVKNFDIQSTPTFRIGDQTIVGAARFETFEKAIEAELKKTK